MCQWGDMEPIVEKEENTENAGGILFALPANCSIETVESVAEEMRAKALDKQKVVVVDFAEVERFTSAGLQLLLSLEKSLSEQSGKLSIANINSTARSVFVDMGFERIVKPA